MNRCIALEADSGLGCGCHCAALAHLAASSPENQRAIAAAGGVVAVVEAMKMQNVLRAPRAGVIKKLLRGHETVGQNLKVDEAILEFE